MVEQTQADSLRHLGIPKVDTALDVPPRTLGVVRDASGPAGANPDLR